MLANNSQKLFFCISLNYTTTNTNQQPIVFNTIKYVSEQYLNTLDKILVDQMRSDGRIRKNEEVARWMATKAMKIQHLEKILSVSSGKLVCNNIFCLYENVRNIVVKDDNQKKQKQNEVQTQKDTIKRKHEVCFKQAAIKHFSKRTLLFSDMEALVKQSSWKNDSPIRTKAKELREQKQKYKPKQQWEQICCKK
jgi:hypothetical protein